MKYILSALLSCFVLYSNAQQINVDQRIVEKFGAEKVQIWQTSKSDSIAFYTFFLDHSYEIYGSDYAKQKTESFIPIEINSEKLQLLLTNRLQFNVLLEDWVWKNDNSQWFHIQNSDYCLLLHSMNYLVLKFKSGKL